MMLSAVAPSHRAFSIPLPPTRLFLCLLSATPYTKESDENENQIAMCTLRSFPFLPLHCIEFAKQAYFSDYFEFGPDQYETFRKDREQFFEQVNDATMSRGGKMLKIELLGREIIAM